MKVFAILGLTLALVAINVDAKPTECLRHIPVGPELCGPPRNALVLYPRRVVQCCASSKLYPVLTSNTVEERFDETCECVSSDVLCDDNPERCVDGAPIQRFISL